MSEFKEILEIVKETLEKKGYKCGPIRDKVEYPHLWISDTLKTPESRAHYEIILYDDQLSIEFHCEQVPEKKNEFKRNPKINSIVDDNKSLRWFDERGLVRIQYIPKYTLSVKNKSKLSEKLINKIIEFENLIGESVRQALKEINNKKIRKG